MAPEINFDFDRRDRIGLSEAVFCAGKTPEQIAQAVAMAQARQLPLLLTRLEPAAFGLLPPPTQTALDYDPPSRTAVMGVLQKPDRDPLVAVVTAGTSDLPVAREASRTLATGRRAT